MSTKSKKYKQFRCNFEKKKMDKQKDYNGFLCETNELEI